jgi:hypothetical protein
VQFTSDDKIILDWEKEKHFTSKTVYISIIIYITTKCSSDDKIILDWEKEKHFTSKTVYIGIIIYITMKCCSDDKIILRKRRVFYL